MSERVTRDRRNTAHCPLKWQHLGVGGGYGAAIASCLHNQPVARRLRCAALGLCSAWSDGDPGSVLVKLDRKPGIAQRVLRSTNEMLFRSGVRRITSSSLPDFLVIGSPQSGTSWLHDKLSMHPQVFVPKIKEVRFFDQRFDRGLAFYASLYGTAGKSIKGDISPSYGIISPSRIEVVRKILPEVRLILLARHPVNRAWSAARRVLGGSGGGAVTELAETLSYLEHEHEFRSPSGSARKEYDPSLKRGHYTRVIDNWLNAYPPEQMLVCCFEKLMEEPGPGFSRILKHIGAPLPDNLEQYRLRERINSNPPGDMPGAVRELLQDLYGHQVIAMMDRYPAEFHSWRGVT